MSYLYIFCNISYAGSLNTVGKKAGEVSHSVKKESGVIYRQSIDYLNSHKGEWKKEIKPYYSKAKDASHDFIKGFKEGYSKSDKANKPGLCSSNATYK